MRKYYTNQFQIPLLKTPLVFFPIELIFNKNDNNKTRTLDESEGTLKLVIEQERGYNIDGSVGFKKEKVSYPLLRKSNMLGKIALLSKTAPLLIFFSFLFFSINRDRLLEVFFLFASVIGVVYVTGYLKDYKKEKLYFLIWKYSYILFLLIGVIWLVIEPSFFNLVDVLYLSGIWFLWEYVLNSLKSKINTYKYYTDNGLGFYLFIEDK